MQNSALERLYVRETLERYFHAVDAKDSDALHDCFAVDAVATYYADTPDQVIVTGGTAIAQNIYTTCCRFTASHHCISNVAITVDGKTAEASTFAIANVIVGTLGMMRGLRYLDYLVRLETGWQIKTRRHVPLWQHNFETASPKLF